MSIVTAVVMTFSSTLYVPADTELEIPQTVALEEVSVEEGIGAETGENFIDVHSEENGLSEESITISDIQDDAFIADAEEEFENDISEEPAHTEEEIAEAESERNTPADELGYIPGEILIVYNSEIPEATIEETAEELDGEVSLSINNGSENIAVVGISDETTVDKAIEEYETDPNIAFAEPNYILVDMEDGAGNGDTGYDFLNAIHASGESGAFAIADNWVEAGNPLYSVKAGIIDTGFDLGLLQGKYDEELSRRLFTASEGISDRILAAEDQGGSLHGTNVADILARTAGSALDSIVLVDAAVDNNNYTVASVAYAINYLKSKVKVINMSLGTVTGASSVVLYSAVKAAYSEGVIMVCAAGNSTGSDTVYPSDYSETISVMSVNEDFGLWEGSGFGALKDIAAPGTNICGVDGRLYSGTSLSAPMVAGAVSLILSVLPNLSFPKVLDILLSTANDASGVPVLDAGNALTAVTGIDIPQGINLNDAVIDMRTVENDVWYPGWEKDIVVTYNGHALENKVDYEVTETSEVLNENDTITLSVSIQGKNVYSGNVQKTVLANKVNVADCLYRLEGERVLNGDDPVTLEVSLEYVVKNGCVFSLKPDQDYSVTYGENNTSGAKTGVIYIAGTGYAAGNREIYFEIFSPEQVLYNGSCGDEADYNLYADGSLVISGRGMAHREFYSETDDRYKKIKTVRIEDGITGIGVNLFEKCSNIVSVDIPDSVEFIGTGAFSGCTALRSAAIPGEIENIPAYAFYECSSLTEISLPANVRIIEAAAFMGCSSLTGIQIPDSVTEIQHNAFRNCTALESIHLPDGLTKISELSFASCKSLMSISLPEAVTELEDYAFDDCSSLTEIAIPENLTAIGNFVFNGCGSLTEICLPDCLETIGQNTFYHCSSLVSVDLGENLRAISYMMFCGCSSLQKVNLPANLESIGDMAFFGCLALETIQIPDTVTEIGEQAFEDCSGLENINIPQGLSEIKDYTFSGCSGLRSIAFPVGVQSIGNHALEDCGFEEITLPENLEKIGDSAFRKCENLKRIELPENITDIGDGLFMECKSLQEVSIESNISEICSYMFYECSSLQNISLPDSIKKLGECAFAWCGSLKEIMIPAGLPVIPKGAFSGCGLENVTIPESVREIGEEAFASCAKLQEVQFPMKSIRFRNGAFYHCGLEHVTLLSTGYINPQNYKNYFDETVTADFIVSENNGNSGQCGENAFWSLEEDGQLLIIGGTGVINALDSNGASVWADCTASITEVEIGEGITAIGNTAFKDFTRMKTLSVPEHLTVIGAQAFANCEALSEFSVSGTVQEIGSMAFYNCKSLKTVEFDLNPEIRRIGENTFAGCESLEKIDLSLLGSLTGIGTSAFSGCSSLRYIHLPSAVQEIGAYAFYSCGQLEWIRVTRGSCENLKIGECAFARCGSLWYVDIAKEVSAVENMAFFQCTSLREVPFRGSLKHIGKYAFYGCTGFESLCVLPASLRTIDDYAFYGCDGFTEIIFPNSVTGVGKFAFADNDTLQTVHILGADILFGKQVFYRDLCLNQLEIPEGFRSFDETSFDFCESLEPEYMTELGISEYTGARASDYDGFADDPEAPTQSLVLEEGESYFSIFGYYFGTKPPVSSCDAIVSVERADDGYYIVHANAPGEAVILYKSEDGETLRYAISVKTPVEADPDNLYKEPGSGQTPTCPHTKRTVKTVKTVTCGAAGTKRYTCTACGESYDETIPATGKHQYTNKVIKAATCGKAGTRRYTCSVCGHYYDKSIAATGKHSYTSKVIKSATCVKSGTRRYTCSVCRKYYDKTIAATGKHKYSSKVIKTATCGKAGTRRYTCSLCGKNYNESIPATGKHKYTSRVLKAATCGKNGTRRYTCSVCGKYYDRPIAATGNHRYTSRVIKAATCGRAGTRRYTCSVCGKYYDKSIPATGRHTYTSVITKQATYTATGIRKFTCTRCRHSYTAVIPKKTRNLTS